MVSWSKSTTAPRSRASSAQASAASLGAPAATARASTRLPSKSRQYSAAAVPDFPSPKMSTRPRRAGACFLPANQFHAFHIFHNHGSYAPSVVAKYSTKPQAASMPDTIQKRTTTFVSDQPFFSK